VTGESLAHLNTLGVTSRAREVQVIASIQDLEDLAPTARKSGLVVLGGGSNVILGDWLEEPVWLMRNRGIGVEAMGGIVEVTVAAGENWHNLVRWSLARGYSGLENLALIPGSAGGAPVQNIGAYGAELASRFVRLSALDVEAGRMISLDRAACQFGYRTSVFKSQPGRYVIGEVTLALDVKPTEVVSDYADLAAELNRMGVSDPTPVQVAEAVIRVRRRKLPDPRFVPNAGSFFKNPIVSGSEYDGLCRIHGTLAGRADGGRMKLAAAELIDRCGFKENTAAPVRVWQRQPLVLTNPERRPADDVLAYADRIRDAVESRFGVRLELEPDTFGC
jgi:UDP-N-acetylmuramate dehydrogenase